ARPATDRGRAACPPLDRTQPSGFARERALPPSGQSIVAATFARRADELLHEAATGGVRLAGGQSGAVRAPAVQPADPAPTKAATGRLIRVPGRKKTKRFCDSVAVPLHGRVNHSRRVQVARDVLWSAGAMDRTSSSRLRALVLGCVLSALCAA